MRASTIFGPSHATRARAIPPLDYLIFRQLTQRLPTPTVVEYDCYFVLGLDYFLGNPDNVTEDTNGKR